MATESIQGLRYPLPSDPNDPPADIKNLADDVVTKLNMLFPTEGARNAAIPSPVDGMECYIGTGATAVKYIRHDGQWVDMWSDVPWTNIALNSGFTSLTLPQWKRRSGKIYLRGAINGALTGSSSGVLAATLPALAIPGSYVRAVGASSDSVRRLNIDTSGNLYLNAGSGSNASWMALDSIAPYWAAGAS